MFMFDVMQSYMRVTLLFCFKQKTAYELRISDWSSDVCSSDLVKRSLFLHRFHKQGIAPRALIVGDHREPEVEDPDGFRGIGDIGVPSILRAPLDRELLGIVAGEVVFLVLGFLEAAAAAEEMLSPFRDEIGRAHV